MNRSRINTICAFAGVLSFCLLISPLCAEQKPGASDCLDVKNCSAEEVEIKLFVQWRVPEPITLVPPGVPHPIPGPESIKPPPTVILFFGSNSDGIAPEYQAHLDKIGRALVNNPQAPIWIEGHTDGIGSEYYNMQLSETRALSVKKYLRDKFIAISTERMIVRGFGKSHPIASNTTQEGQRQNRRVEFVNRCDPGESKTKSVPEICKPDRGANPAR